MPFWAKAADSLSWIHFLGLDVSITPITHENIWKPNYCLLRCRASPVLFGEPLIHHLGGHSKCKGLPLPIPCPGTDLDNSLQNERMTWFCLYTYRCAHSPSSKQTAELQLYQLYHHIISIFLLIKRTSLDRLPVHVRLRSLLPRKTEGKLQSRNNTVCRLPF
jgi:hypothetical protein